MTEQLKKQKQAHAPSLGWALLPLAFLLLGVVMVIVCMGADYVQLISKPLMLVAGVLAIVIARLHCRRSWRVIALGIGKSWRQISPAIIVLLLIGTVSATWMLSGVVPTLIDYGLQLLNQNLFLFTACAVCSVISVLTGSSWTTIATIGIALMGIGKVMGYSDGWIAGAIISGAYFGDKISPLSDTTVLASSSCGVRLFDHIRYMMFTTTPSMVIALTVFLSAGYLTETQPAASTSEVVEALHGAFNITPWVLSIPIITLALIAMRVHTTLTLTISTLLGLAGIFIFQPDVLAALALQTGLTGLEANVAASVKLLCTVTELSTGSPLLDSLVCTGGIEGMMSTVLLVLCALFFGGTLMGAGILTTLTHAVTRHLDTMFKTVSATVCSGLFLNCFTGDQYLSIILAGNLYKSLYQRHRLEPRLLSRSIEDSISVTSVLVPWNSCGVTQATVLNVPTLTYLPYCVFNYLSPLMSVFMAWTGFKIKRAVTSKSRHTSF
jgi:NhaC family Na+:H+ antiporter